MLRNHNTAYSNTVEKQNGRKQNADLLGKVIDGETASIKSEMSQGVNTKKNPQIIVLDVETPLSQNPLIQFARATLGFETHEFAAHDIANITPDIIQKSSSVEAKAIDVRSETVVRRKTLKSDKKREGTPKAQTAFNKNGSDSTQVAKQDNQPPKHDSRPQEIKTASIAPALNKNTPPSPSHFDSLAIDPKPEFNAHAPKQIKTSGFMDSKDLAAPVEGTVPLEPTLSSRRVFEAGLEREENAPTHDHRASVIGRDMNEYYPVPDLALAA